LHLVGILFLHINDDAGQNHIKNFLLLFSIVNVSNSEVWFGSNGFSRCRTHCLTDIWHYVLYSWVYVVPTIH